MRELLLVVGLVLGVQTFAQAQTEFPKAEILGGFSILNRGKRYERDPYLGWQASAAFNRNKMNGIVADFSGDYREQYEETVRIHHFLFGPQATARREKASYFAHLLVGYVNLRGDHTGEDAFAMGIGGGVDVRTSDRVAVRVVQFDCLPTRFWGGWLTSEVRFGFGIVFKVQ